MAWPDLADCALSPAVVVFDHGDATYTPPGGATAFAVRMIYNGEHVAVDLDTGVAVDTHVPAVGVRLQDFLDIVGAQPEQGAEVTIGSLVYLVRSVQPDGEGGALLELEQLR
jgi:hypothetical protein